MNLIYNLDKIMMNNLKEANDYIKEIYQDRLGNYNLETMKLKTLIENCK